MIRRDELIAIGQYRKPHGIDGELSATIETPLALVERARCLVSDIDGIFVPFFVESMRPKSEHTLLLSITGIHNEREASTLVNKEIFILKQDYGRIAQEESEEDVPDELPVDYFIGFDVVINQQVEGTVTDVDDKTINVLFVVETTEGDTLLVPAVDEMIDEIDLDERLITMSVPDELLQL